MIDHISPSKIDAVVFHLKRKKENIKKGSLNQLIKGNHQDGINVVLKSRNYKKFKHMQQKKIFLNSNEKGLEFTFLIILFSI